MRWMLHLFGWAEGGKLMKWVHILYKAVLETWGGSLTERPGLMDGSVDWFGMSVRYITDTS
jgi:hypothetical protein